MSGVRPLPLLAMWRLSIVLAAAGCAASPSATCVNDRDCATGEVCHYNTGQCTAASAGADAGQACQADGECGSGLCSAGTCACTRDGWSSYASGFFAANCTRCHGWAGSLSEVQRKAGSLRGNLEANAMPPNLGVSADDQARMLRWLDCGTPP